MRGFVLDTAQWLDQIHQGDCLELMRKLPDETVDLVITSPPYNLLSGAGRGMKGAPSGKWLSGKLLNGYDGHSDDLPHDDYVAWQRQCLAEMFRVLKPDGAIFYNHKPRVQNGCHQSRMDILEGFPLRQIIIWHRSGDINHNPGYFLPTYECIYLIAKPGFKLVKGNTDESVWKVDQERDPWIKEIPCFPVAIPQRAIRATTASVVLDPFVGSGTTAVAAMLEGRHYIGIDQSSRYCEVARRRLETIDPENGTPSMPIQEFQPCSIEDIPARGSARVVFRYIRDAVAKNGWEPTVIFLSDIANHLQLHKDTVYRATKTLKQCGAITAQDHGRWSTYELVNPPRTADTSPRREPETADTPAENPPRTADTSPRREPETADTPAENPPRTADTSPRREPETADTPAENPPRTADTSPDSSTKASLGHSESLERATGTGVKPDESTLKSPTGTGRADEPHCPAHAGQAASWHHKDDRVFRCHVAECSWVGSEKLGDIVPPGHRPIKQHQLASVYHEKQYRPVKWARKYGHTGDASQVAVQSITASSSDVATEPPPAECPMHGAEPVSLTTIRDIRAMDEALGAMTYYCAYPGRNIPGIPFCSWRWNSHPDIGEYLPAGVDQPVSVAQEIAIRRAAQPFLKKGRTADRDRARRGVRRKQEIKS